MGLFGKVEYRKIELPFYYLKQKEDIKNETGAISIEAYGSIDGVGTYFYITFILTKSFMYDNGDYEDMIRVLKKMKNERLAINLKYRRNKLVNFKLEDKTLGKNTGDQRFDNVEIIFRSFGEKSMRQEGLGDYE